MTIPFLTRSLIISFNASMTAAALNGDGADFTQNGAAGLCVTLQQDSVLLIRLSRPHTVMTHPPHVPTHAELTLYKKIWTTARFLTT